MAPSMIVARTVRKGHRQHLSDGGQMKKLGGSSSQF
jgi:hypothetical protein